MVNKRGYQALNAVALVAGASQTSTVTAARIAKALDLSVSHIESLVKDLRAHGLLTSFRGPGGGYQLSKAASEISAWDILGIFQTASQNRIPTQAEADPAIAWLENAALNTMAQHVENFKLSDLIPETVHEIPLAPMGEGRFNFKPLPRHSLPKAANSVFDLSRYMNLESA